MDPRPLQARLRRYFVAGFFALVPLLLSLFAALWLIQLADNTLSPATDAALGRHVPGVGLVCLLALILGAGIAVSHGVGEHLLEMVEEALLRVPAFKWLYGTIKRLTEAFSPEGKKSFESVVVVEYPRPGIYSLGFATRETKLVSGGKSEELVSVYVPTNHMYIGDLILVPKAHVIRTTLPVQDGVQAILSAGAALPDVLDARSRA